MSGVESTQRSYADDHGPFITIATTFMLVVSLFMVAIRLLIRTPWREMLGKDDALTFTATVFSVCYTALSASAAHDGLGERKAPSKADSDNIARFYHISNIFYALAVASSQCAVALMILRLSKHDGVSMSRYKTLDKVIFATCGGIVLWAIVSVVVFAAWVAMHVGLASQREIVAVGTLEALSALLELPLVIGPIIVIGKLQMKVSRKLSVMSTFGARFILHFPAILRLTSLHNASVSHNSNFDAAVTVIWTAIELNAIVSGATLPCLFPFFRVMNSNALTMVAGGEPGSSYLNSRELQDLKMSSRSRERERERDDRRIAVERTFTVDDGGSSPTTGGKGKDGSDNISVGSYGSQRRIVKESLGRL